MNVLFVCTGNVCRSVIAEKLFQKILNEKGIKDIQAKSAGTAANPEYKIYGYLSEVMTGAGIDFSAHISTPVTFADITWADLILVMEKSHRDFIQNNFPDAQSKVYLLKEYVGEGEGEIPDPLGKPPPAHLLTLQEIERCVRKLVEKIVRVPKF